MGPEINSERQITLGQVVEIADEIAAIVELWRVDSRQLKWDAPEQNLLAEETSRKFGRKLGHAGIQALAKLGYEVRSFSNHPDVTALWIRETPRPSAAEVAQAIHEELFKRGAFER